MSAEKQLEENLNNMATSVSKEHASRSERIQKVVKRLEAAGVEIETGYGLEHPLAPRKRTSSLSTRSLTQRYP